MRVKMRSWAKREKERINVGIKQHSLSNFSHLIAKTEDYSDLPVEALVILTSRILKLF